MSYQVPYSVAVVPRKFREYKNIVIRQRFWTLYQAQTFSRQLQKEVPEDIEVDITDLPMPIADARIHERDIVVRTVANYTHRSFAVSIYKAGKFDSRYRSSKLSKEEFLYCINLNNGLRILSELKDYTFSKMGRARKRSAA